MELHVISGVKLKQQNKTVENPSVARTQRMNRNTVGTLFNMLKILASENKLFDTPGNILNIDEIGIQINTKPNSVIKKGV
jgi:hypothetical protein